jgi:hypothetical protein
MQMRRMRAVAMAVVLAVVLSAVLAPAAQALPTPSKTAADQTLVQREADLAALGAVLDQPQVAGALEAQGLTRDQVNERLAQLSPEELAGLASQVDQLQAAGQPMYIWIMLAVLIVVAIVAIAE